MIFKTQTMSFSWENWVLSKSLWYVLAVSKYKAWNFYLICIDCVLASHIYYLSESYETKLYGLLAHTLDLKYKTWFKSYFLSLSGQSLNDLEYISCQWICCHAQNKWDQIWVHFIFLRFWKAYNVLKIKQCFMIFF